jgi:hypothetical protein
MKILLAAVLLLFGVAMAEAAQVQLSIVFQGSPSTSITCPIAGPFTVPVAAGTQICAITVAPAGWQGALTLSGADAAAFAISGSNLVVGPTAITAAGTKSVTLTAAP